MSQGRALLPDWGGQLGPQAHPEATAAPGLACSCAPACGPPLSAQPEESSAASLSFSCLPPPTRGKPVSRAELCLHQGWPGQPQRRDAGGPLAHIQRLGCTELPSKIHGLPAKSLSFLLEKLKFILGCPVTASTLLLPPGLVSHHQKDLRPGRVSGSLTGSLASRC